MLNRFLIYLRNNSGSIMPLTAVMMPIILAMTGVGVDVSMWMSEKRDLQSAADAAAVAAAWEIANDFDDYAEYAALKEAENNGYDSSAAGSNLNLTITTNTEGRPVVTATVTQQSSTYFSKLVFHDDVYTTTQAAAIVDEPIGDFCLLSLDESTSGAITTSGSVTIDSAGCGMAINSSSDSALFVNGNVDITMDGFNIVGDYETRGGSATIDYNTMNTNASAMPDPYEDLEVPDYGRCDYNNTRVRRDTVLQPGVYCGGITVSGGAEVDFEPGVYILDGGDFDVSGGGSLRGDEVSFVLTSSSGRDYGQIDITGSTQVFFTAPAPGDEMEGVVIYRDRNAPSARQCSKMTGTSDITLQGAAYMPTDCIRIGGNSTSSSPSTNPCSRLIAQTITLHGNPRFGNDCEGTGVRDIGVVNVRLIM